MRLIQPKTKQTNKKNATTTTKYKSSPSFVVVPVVQSPIDDGKEQPITVNDGRKTGTAGIWIAEGEEIVNAAVLIIRLNGKRTTLRYNNNDKSTMLLIKNVRSALLSIPHPAINAVPKFYVGTERNSNKIVRNRNSKKNRSIRFDISSGMVVVKRIKKITTRQK